MPDPAIFASMGMLIIDEIHYDAAMKLPAQEDVLGGGGTFAALGARVVVPAGKSTGIGWFVDKGADFPLAVEEYLRNWNTGAVWREDRTRRTTRGWNHYHQDEFREFKYLSDKKRIVVEDLLGHESLLRAKSYHLICSPLRCLEILDRLTQERERIGWLEKPIVIWEVIPDLCNAENLQDVQRVLDKIDVFTPNAEEAARLYGLTEPKRTQDLEQLSSKFLPFVKGGIVLRCGPLGCLTQTHDYKAWWPAYQNEKNPTRRVIDPTGGGNTFIGAFATGLVLTGDWDIASICGNISAGVAIEQIGMPTFDGVDKWNGKALKERLESYFKWNGIDKDSDEVLVALGH